jgi:serralysin
MANIVKRMLNSMTPLTAFLRLQSLTLASLVAACGGGGTSTNVAGSQQQNDDDIQDEPLYSGPVSDTVDVSQPFNLRPVSEDSPWVGSLQSEFIDGVPNPNSDGKTVFKYMFPTERPFYLRSDDGRGWREATPEMKAAFEDVFQGLEAVFNIDFVETGNIADRYTIAIQVNEQNQMNSAAYAYYPSLFPIGFDIFIDDDYANPEISDGIANYDYETLVHELGHALALKHPFDNEGGTAPVLPTLADNSQWTVMTYTDYPAYFDGFFRDLDLMALADLYGVNTSFRSGDDTYEFSDSGGVFVIDGNGFDTIDASEQTRDVRINLNEETTSYVGSEGAYIVVPNQLTISANTSIEAALGGSGNDYLIGNDFDNLLEANEGDDEIFAGLGADTVAGGAGDDIIDLSESVSSSDVYVLLDQIDYNGADLVYNFEQGDMGDVVSHALFEDAQLLNVVTASASLARDISGDILRLIGTGIDAASDLVVALSDEGSLSGIDIREGEVAFLIISGSDEKGETQTLFTAALTEGVYEATVLTAFVGYDVDIGLWTDANFVA